MFEQSLILDSRHGAKAGALAFSLTTQTAVAGVLLLIPLLYTERLPLVQLTLPTFLPPPPPHPPVRQDVPVVRRRSPGRFWNGFLPTRIPPLYTKPEIVDDAPPIPDGLQGAAPPFLDTAALPQISVILPPPPPPKPFPIDTVEKPVAVSATILAAKLIRKVVPSYPAMAKLARVSGTVHLLGIVGKDGRIQQLHVTSGPALLVEAAVDAVRQWIYSPTLLNGKPVEVSAPIDVIFTLSQ